MKMNSGSVSRGYQFSRAMLALKGISAPPSPHRHREKRAAMKPMAPNTRCPVMSMSISSENIKSAMSSWLTTAPSPGPGQDP